MSEPLLQVEGLKVHFPVHGSGLFRRQTGTVRAVDGVDFEIARGETLGLVGESGCGKTTTGLSLLRLVEPTSGTVTFDGVDITSLGKRDMRAMRRRMSMIFQDPLASLDPRMSVSDIVGEPIVIHGLADSTAARNRRIGELMELVGLNPDYRNRYPHEFSGGQRQRVGIARALATEPDFIVCDEPIAALDVSIQAQIMNLMEELQDELGLTYLFIAHDLAAVQHFSDRIAVMYLGMIAETADRRSLATHPRHPYTEALLSAVPVPDPVVERSRTRLLLEGDVPSPLDPPSGCRFHPRCRYAFDRCPVDVPALIEAEGTHKVACHLDEGRGLSPT
jgi:oligopeptide/dipeptide ABC transporter ATP-binding protein